MIPLLLNVRNFLCYRENVPPLPFDGIHVACLCGSNGHGKSALLDAITWCLWGKGRGKSQDELISYGADEARVELEFAARDNHYRVIRSHSRARGQRRPGVTLLELQVVNGGLAQGISGNSVRETQAKIEQLVGMDYDTFINSAFLLQGRADEFTNKTPAERKAVLCRILGLDTYDRLRELARARLEEKKNAAADTEGALRQMRMDVEELGDPAGELTSVSIRLDMVNRQINDKIQELSDLRVQLLELKRQRSQLDQWRQQCDTLQKDITQFQASIAAAQGRIQEQLQLIGQGEAIEQGAEQLAQSRRQYEQLEQARQQFDALNVEKGRLEQTISNERVRLEAQVSQLRAQIDEQLTPKANAEAGLLIQQQEAAQQLEILSQELDQLASQLAETCRQVEAARGEAAELQRRRDQLSSDKKQHESSQRDIEQLEKSVTDIQDRMAQAQQVIDQGEAIRQGVEQLTQSRRQYEQLEQARQQFDALNVEKGRLEQTISNERVRLEAQISQLRRRAETDLIPRANGAASLLTRQLEIEQRIAGLLEEEEQVAGQRNRLLSLENQIGQAQTNAERHKVEGQELRAKLDLLNHDHHEAACPLCGTSLGWDGCQRLIQTYETEITGKRRLFRQNQAHLQELEGQKSFLEQDLPRLEQALSRQQQETQAALLTVAQQIKEATAAREELTQVEHEIDDLVASAQSGSFAPEEQSRLHKLINQLAGLGYREGDRQSIYQQIQELTPFEAQLQQLNQAITRLGEERQSVSQCQEMLQRRQEEQFQLAERIQLAESAVAGLPALEQYLRQAENTQAEQESQQRELSRRQEVIRYRRQELERQLGESRQAQQELVEKSQRLAAFESSLKSGYFAAAEQAQLQSIQAQLAALGYDDAARQETYRRIQQLLPFENRKLQLDDARQRLPGDIETLAQSEAMAQRRQDEMAELTQRIQAAESAVAELPQLENRLSDAERAVSELEGSRQAALNRRYLLEDQLRRLEDLRRESEVCQTRLLVLQEEQSIFQELVTAFGRQGVQAMLIETVMPRLEEEANLLLGRMTDHRMHVKLETQRERRSGRGNDPIETLEIYVSDELGSRSYDMYSGGEAFRVNLALRIALSRVLSQRMGAPLPTLFIDEGFGTQDSAGRERIMDVISAIQEDFDKIVVITHLDELKDMFPVRIQVQKDGNGSTFEILYG